MALSFHQFLTATFARRTSLAAILAAAVGLTPIAASAGSPKHSCNGGGNWGAILQQYVGGHSGGHSGGYSNNHCPQRFVEPTLRDELFFGQLLQLDAGDRHHARPRSTRWWSSRRPRAVERPSQPAGPATGSGNQLPGQQQPGQRQEVLIANPPENQVDVSYLVDQRPVTTAAGQMQTFSAGWWWSPTTGAAGAVHTLTSGTYELKSAPAAGSSSARPSRLAWATRAWWKNSASCWTASR